MAKISPIQKLAKKRDLWVQRTMQVTGMNYDSTRELLRTGRHQSLRLNPLAADRKQTLQALRLLGWRGEPVSWCQDGYTLDAGLKAVRDSQLATDGAVLIQNAASWLPVLALDPQAGDYILDVCAAPGGKTTHVAALVNNEAHIIANDNSRARLMKLQSMCARLRAEVQEFTLYDALSMGRRLSPESFDRILLDAPCSGEGMMQYDNDKDFESWSVAHIKRLQQLQKRMLVQAWQLLKPGGTLVYSTCTMAPEENEAVIDYGLRALESVVIMPLTTELPNRIPVVGGWNGRTYNPALQGCLRLIPSRETEAFFVCKLIKQR